MNTGTLSGLLRVGRVCSVLVVLFFNILLVPSALAEAAPEGPSAQSVSIQATAVPLPPRQVQPGGKAEEALRVLLVNQSDQSDTLQSLTLTNTSGVDGNWAHLTLLVAADGDLNPAPTENKSGINSGEFHAGILNFSGLQIVLGPRETTQLVVRGQASLTARSGDLLSVAIMESSSLSFTGSVTRSGSWPLTSEGALAVGGILADELDLRPVDPSQFMIGSIRNLAFDVGLPASGYEGDHLDRLNIINIGNARYEWEIARMEAWADDGDETLDPSTDTLLGAFIFTGNRWELTGLNQIIPAGSLRIFVTVDIAESAVAGRALQLGLPTLPDVGIGMGSGNDGPIDQEVINPFAQSISAADRIILSSGVIVPGTVVPGQSDVPLLHLVALNTYTTYQRLTELSIRNGTSGLASPGSDNLDREMDQLKLRADGNGDGVLGDLASDPIIATGSFSQGTVTFSGLSWNLAAGASNHLFLTGDVSLSEATDGDVLSAYVAGGVDLSFVDEVSLSAVWPLDSGALWTVDGMMAAQVVSSPVPVVTLAADEGPALVMDLVLPSNGYAADNLAGLQLVNLGTAGENDLADLRLWRDGGDGIFSGGAGDDVDLGPCVWVSGAWRSPVLDIPLPQGGLRIFVGLTVDAAPTNGATVKLAVPVDGISVASGNDGPRDQQVESPGTILLSTAPLLTDVQILEPVSNLGQAVTVRMLARNVGTEDLVGVTPQTLTSSGDGFLNLLGGPTPASLNLASGAIDSFTWTYSGTAAGEVTLTGNAQGTGSVGGQLRESLTSESGAHRIFEPADTLEMFAVANMPFSINRGQADVVPLSLTFINPGSAQGADVLIQNLRIRLRDGAGGGIVPSELLSRVVVNEGGITYLDQTNLETSGDQIFLALDQPVLVTGLEPVTLGLRLDIRADTTVPSFMVEIGAQTWIAATDAISGAPVQIVLQDGTYPVQSGLGTLLVEATDFQVTALPATRQPVSFGQQDVTLLVVDLVNHGTAGLGSSVRVGSLAFSLTDTLGAPLAEPSQVLDRLQVTSPLQTVLDVSVAAVDSSVVLLDLTSPITVSVDTPLRLTLMADIADPALTGAVQVRLADPSSFVVVDANSGVVVPVTYQSNPVVGNTIAVKQAATELMALGSPLLPEDLVIGARQVPAMEVELRHPGGADVAAIEVQSLLVQCRNEDRELVSPSGVIDVLEVIQGAVPIGFINNPVGDGNMILPLNGIVLQPGETVALTLRLGLEVLAPAGSLELIIPANGFHATDENLNLMVTALPESGEEFPLTSGLVRLLESADELRVDFTSAMPAVLVNSAAEIPVALVNFRNPDQGGTGGIDLASVTVRAANDLLDTIPVGSSVEEIILYNGDEIWATSGVLDPADQVGSLVSTSANFIGPGVTLALELRARFRSSPTEQRVRLGIADGDIGVVQLDDGLITVRVEPENGQLFPFWSETGFFTGASLAESYSNFPNPFGSGQESTVFVFSLERPATVSLKLMTAHAAPVLTLINEEFRPAGLYQQDRWEGRNGRGGIVQNGVYVAELIVVYQDGTEDRLRRKVAVVR